MAFISTVCSRAQLMMRYHKTGQINFYKNVSDALQYIDEWRKPLHSVPITFEQFILSLCTTRLLYSIFIRTCDLKLIPACRETNLTFHFEEFAISKLVDLGPCTIIHSLTHTHTHTYTHARAHTCTHICKVCITACFLTRV